MPADAVAGSMSGGATDALAFGIAADLVYNVMSATNSSPQTTELFAGDRSQTLWKYVRLGLGQSAILVGIMAIRGRTVWPVLGGLAAGAAMHLMYAHALQAGQAKSPPAGAS
jgi:hypothetical protein